MRIITAALGAALFLFGSAPAASALTLEEAVETALADNPSLKAADAQSRAADGMADAARAGLLPTVDLSETYVKTNSPMQVLGIKLNRERVTQGDFAPDLLNDPADTENWKTTLSVRQPIFAGGAVYYGYRSAAAASESAVASKDRARSQVVYRVVEAWMNVWLFDRKIDVLETSRRLAEQSLEVTRNREEAGMAHRTDTLDMRINYDRVRQEVNAAAADRITALDGLTATLGLPGESRIEPIFGDYAIPPTGTDLAQLVDEGLKNRADLTAMEKNALAADYRARAATGAFLPEVGVSYRQEWNGADFAGTDGDAWLVAVEAKLNLFEGGKTAANRRAAKARFAALEFGRDAARDNARVEIGEAYRGVATARNNLTIALSQVTLAEESYGIADEQYREGVKSATDLLRAQTQRENAHLGYHHAVYRLILAQARLDLATGRTETSIKEKF